MTPQIWVPFAALIDMVTLAPDEMARAAPLAAVAATVPATGPKTREHDGPLDEPLIAVPLNAAVMLSPADTGGCACDAKNNASQWKQIPESSNAGGRTAGITGGDGGKANGGCGG